MSYMYGRHLNKSTYNFVRGLQDVLDLKVGSKSRLMEYDFQLQHLDNQCLSADERVVLFIMNEIGINNKQMDNFLLNELSMATLNVHKLNQTRSFGWIPVWDLITSLNSSWSSIDMREAGGGSGLGFQIYCKSSSSTGEEEGEVIIATGGGGGGGGIDFVMSTFGGGGGGGIQYRQIKPKQQPAINGSDMGTNLSDWYSRGGGGGCGTVSDIADCDATFTTASGKTVYISCGQSLDDNIASESQMNIASAMQQCYSDMNNKVILRGGGGGGGGGVGGDNCSISFGYGFGFEIEYSHRQIENNIQYKDEDELGYIGDNEGGGDDPYDTLSQLMLDVSSLCSDDNGVCAWGCRCYWTKLLLNESIMKNCGDAVGSLSSSSSKYESLSNRCQADPKLSLVWNMYIAYSHIKCPACASSPSSPLKLEEETDTLSQVINSKHSHCFTLSDNIIHHSSTAPTPTTNVYVEEDSVTSDSKMEIILMSSNTATGLHPQGSINSMRSETQWLLFLMLLVMGFLTITLKYCSRNGLKKGNCDSQSSGTRRFMYSPPPPLTYDDGGGMAKKPRINYGAMTMYCESLPQQHVNVTD
jgi:hypothetical protein